MVQRGSRLRLHRRPGRRRFRTYRRLGAIKVPLSVRFISLDEGYELVASRHRLQAAIELGHKEVPIREEKGTETDARLWEIAENLHRAELTVAERAEHIAEWIRITEDRQNQSGASCTTKEPGQGRGSKGGVRAAERELGIEHTEAQRSVKIAGLAPEAKAEAKILHLDNNQTALLKAAARGPSKEDQLRALREEAARKAARKDDVPASERRIEFVVELRALVADAERELGLAPA